MQHDVECFAVRWLQCTNKCENSLAIPTQQIRSESKQFIEFHWFISVHLDWVQFAHKALIQLPV